MLVLIILVGATRDMRRDLDMDTRRRFRLVAPITGQRHEHPKLWAYLIRLLIVALWLFSDQRTTSNRYYSTYLSNYLQPTTFDYSYS